MMFSHRERVSHMLVTLVASALFSVVSQQSEAEDIPNNYQLTEDAWEVGPGDYIFQEGIPDCGAGDMMPALNDAATVLAEAAQSGKALPYTSLYRVLRDIVPQLTGQLAGTGAHVLDWLFGSHRSANCVNVGVVIPAGAHVFSVNFFAVEQGGPDPHSVASSDCGHWHPNTPNTQTCNIGWSTFDQPIIIEQGSITIVTSRFRNWSHNRTREATMDVLWY